MKAVTEFSVFTITKALQTKQALATAGKTPEEIQENLGQTFKVEGEKLGYLMQSLEVGEKNTQNLKRIVVMKLNEGEKAPAKSIQIEDLAFLPEFLVTTVAPKADADSARGHGKGGGRGGKGGGGPKGSPWGLSPEEKALKNKKPAPQA